MIRKLFDLLRRRQPPQVYVVSGIAAELGLAHRTDYTEYLGAYHSWVYACATIIARNVAKVPLRLYVRKEGGVEEVTDHPLLDLLRKVNPVQTRYELWELTVIWLELTGNAYWYLARNRLGVPVEIWPVQPDRMKVVPGKDRLIQGYLYDYGGKRIAFDVEEIIHLKYPNPRSIYYGMGTLQAAAYSYDTDHFMRRYSINLFRNMARPDSVLTTDQNLTEEEIERVRAEWNKVYGSVENVGKVAILIGGTKLQPYATKPQELDYVAGRKLARDEILGIFGVPASKLGLVEDVNRANAEANDITFQKEVIQPRLAMIAEKLNQDLVPKFDERLELRFDSPVPEDWERRLRERESNLKSGYTSINEERARDGLPPAPWGEAPLLPFNLMPVGSSSSKKAFLVRRKSEEDRRTAMWRQYMAVHRPFEEEFARTLRRLFGDQRRQVLSNLRKALKGRKQQYDPALVDFILFSLEEAEEIFAREAEPRFLQMLLSGAEKAFGDLGAEDVELDIRNPDVVEFLDQRKFKFSFEVNQTTQEQLRRELTEGLRAGEGVEKLTARVNKVFDWAETWRAERIARTEATTALNHGIFQAYRQSGLNPKKKWLTARTEDVRPWHQVMDGQTVGLDEPFISGQGNALMYPGDPQAPPDEIINCRCTMVPVLEGGSDGRI